MDHMTAIRLIQRGVPERSLGIWADLGCGQGLFTNALGQLLEKGSTIYAIDDNRAAVQKIKSIPGIEVKKVVANFERDDMILQELDGILMANSIHYVKDKIAFIKKALKWMKKDSSFIIVEYDTETSNQWVPYPISFDSLHKLFSEFGFTVKKIGEQPSIYNRARMYSAAVKVLSTLVR